MTDADIATSVARYEKDPAYKKLLAGEVPEELKPEAWVARCRELAERCREIRPDLAIVWTRCADACEKANRRDAESTEKKSEVGSER